jgi:voltage-gated potassium channel
MFSYGKVIVAGTILLLVISIGTFGYWVIGAGQYPVVDCLYMTVITITTIGYGEIINLSGNAPGRLFTILIALTGIGTLAYLLSNLTAFIVEGELKEVFRRRSMEKKVNKYREHYIVCGVSGVGYHILEELAATKRPQVLVDWEEEKIEKALARFPDLAYIEDDATDNDTLLKAGIKEARGIFAVTGDDNQNLVITITAKQLNPKVRVVARCNELKNVDKLKRVGADAVVSTTFIGGLRMASEMVRPEVVSFLDVMLRDKDRNLRIEEVPVPPALAGKPLSALHLKRHHDVLVLAVREKEGWVYNPGEEYLLSEQSSLIFMGTPGARERLEKYLKDA